MRREQIIEEPVMVETRCLPGGRIQPQAFHWRGQRHQLIALGRQWVEEVEGRRWRCFLAQTATRDAVELRWQPQHDQWRLHRAWWHESLA